jgi:hypothetical protein
MATDERDIIALLSAANHRWVGRAAAELNLLAALGMAVTRAQSVPDAMQAYQDLVTERLEMVAEDGRRLVEDGEMLARAVARSMTPGRAPTDHATGT